MEIKKLSKKGNGRRRVTSPRVGMKGGKSWKQKVYVGEGDGGIDPSIDPHLRSSYIVWRIRPNTFSSLNIPHKFLTFKMTKLNIFSNASIFFKKNRNTSLIFFNLLIIFLENLKHYLEVLFLAVYVR